MVNKIRLVLLAIAAVGFCLIWWQSSFWLAFGVLLIAIAAAVKIDAG